MDQILNAPTTVRAAPIRIRRRRRSREELDRRIRNAARDLFAERGYDGATTREIARMADVSETLLFRYHGDKATLFHKVVIEPFQAVMDEFVSRFPDPVSWEKVDDAPGVTRRIFELCEENQNIFRAMLATPAGQENGAMLQLRRLAPFFDQSVRNVRRRYDAAEITPPFDLEIAVRLGFGMVVASVLLGGNLFPQEPPSRGAVIRTLEQVVAQAFLGPPSG